MKRAHIALMSAVAVLALAGCSGNTGNGYDSSTFTQTTPSGRTVECVAVINHSQGDVSISCDWEHSKEGRR